MEENLGGRRNPPGVTRSSPPKPEPGGPLNRAEVHKRYSDKFARMARRRGLCGQDVEDAMQKAFVAILESMHSYNPAIGPFDNWALRVGQRTVRHHAAALRKRPDQPEAVDATEPVDLAPNSEQRMSDAQLDAILTTLVELLPDALREVFIMADLERTSMRTIARELGITQRSGYARLYRARKLMARGLKPYQREWVAALPPGFLTLDRLVEIGRKNPPIDPALNARVRDQVEKALGPELGAASAGATTLASGKALVGATKLKAAVAVLLFSGGMAAGAFLYWALNDLPRAVPTVVTIGNVPSLGIPLSASSSPLSVLSARPSDEASHGLSAPPGGSASPSASSARTTPSAPRSSAGPAQVGTGASADEDSSVAERALIQGVRLALRENEPERALDDLRRHRAQFKNPQLADLRDDLWKQAMDLREAKRRPR